MNPKFESRMERKRAATRNQIINAAVELFNQHGLEAVTMEQIAEKADIAKGTLYHYYPSKEAIINAYIQKIFRERNPARLAEFHALPDTRARLTALFTLLIEGVQRQKDIFEVFMLYRMKRVISFQPPVESELSGLSLLVHEILTLGIQNQELRADLPEGTLAGLVEYALIAAIQPFYLAPQSYDARRSIEQCVDLFLRGAQA